MKKADVKIGGEFYANVTNKEVTVRIDAENDHGGWDATNLATGKKIRIKSAQRLRGAVRKANAKTPRPASKPAKEKGDAASDKKLSCLGAALTVLAERGEPMNTKEMIDAMASAGYWTSPGGKTPHATLYSAILRDMKKGDESRFVKAERGRFTVRM